jgi:hypothetical protein
MDGWREGGIEGGMEGGREGGIEGGREGGGREGGREGGRLVLQHYSLSLFFSLSHTHPPVPRCSMHPHVCER